MGKGKGKKWEKKIGNLKTFSLKAKRNIKIKINKRYI